MQQDDLLRRAGFAPRRENIPPVREGPVDPALLPQAKVDDDHKVVVTYYVYLCPKCGGETSIIKTETPHRKHRCKVCRFVFFSLEKRIRPPV